MVVNEFVDPMSKIKLNKDDKGNLYCQKDKQLIIYKNHDGIYDFVASRNLTRERDHYDNKYTKGMSKNLTLQDIYDKWQFMTYPENSILLKSLGNLSGKKILLIGNGTSFKELYFLTLGAQLVYTDLSIQAIKFMKVLFSSSELKINACKNIDFNAVDALHLPFPDSSFDVIYGYRFAHHIKDLDQLFTEIKRCLKKGGICRFLDDAYSPVWHFMKNTILKPLQLYSHKTTRISPEDLRATHKGGYSKDEIIQIMQEFEFNKLFFERISFFQHLWTRGNTKLLGGNNYLNGKGTKIMVGIDNFLSRHSGFMRENQIVLVWGFDK